jgi:hypothetical protein
MLPLLAVAAGAQVTGSLLSAYGAFSAGQQNKKSGELNAALLDMQAKDAELRGEHDANMNRLRTRLLIGKQRTGFAASGVDVDQGTTVEVAADTAMLGEFDSQTIINNAAREAWGYRAQATMARYEGKMADWQGKMSAFGSILGGAAQTASLFAGAKK